MPVQTYDTIIVGLGSAGATAASTLCRAGKRVLALEAQNRIGGRVYTVPFGDGVVEVGAEWIHGTHPSRVYDLATANNVTVLPQDLSFEAYRSDGSNADKAMVNDLLNFALAVVEEPPEKPGPLGEYISRRLMEYIQTKYPQLLTDEDFIDEFLKFMDLIVDNYEASNSWNDVSTQTNYEELSGHQHMSWHRYGYKTFFEILLNTYNGGPGFPNLDIKLNTEVTQIKWPQDPAADVIVTCKDGATYRTKNVIVTVSLGVLKERHATLFSPGLPADKIKSINDVPMGVIGKIILSFPQNWWTKDKTISRGFLWDTKDIKQMGGRGWTVSISGATEPMGGDNILTLWTGGENTKLTLFSPKLPQDKITSIGNIPIGVVAKVIMSYEQAWWNTEINFFGFVWKGADRRIMDKGAEWLTKTDGVTTPYGSNNTLTFWWSGDNAKLIETLPDDEVKRKVLGVLKRFMGKDTTIPEPTAMIRSAWYSNPFTRGSYTYDNLLMAQYPNARANLATPLVDNSGSPRVLFAGEATDPTHFSTVHGASDSGYREANRLLPQAKL